MSEPIEFQHSIDAKLASNIGEESISNPVQAIAELVKNSLDADATDVWISFEGDVPIDKESDRKINKIIIRDNGFAMTVEDLQNKFFRIGTVNKQRNIFSPERKRRVVGDKGMGHVAAKRLGNVCKIISNPREFPEREPSTTINKTISATINWNDFEHGLNFSDVKSKGEILDRDVNEITGLQIEITELNDMKSMSIDKFREIEKTLGMLLVPEDLRTNKNDEFSIHLEGPGEDLRMHEIGHEMGPLDKALIRLTGTAKYDKAKDKTVISYFIEKRIPNKNSPHGYSWDRINQRPNTTKEEHPGKLFGDAKLVLYHFPQGGFGKWKDEQKTLLIRKEIQQFTKKYSGIKIFNDNVRLYPFGERNHPTMYDWAQIDSESMRSQMGGRIRLDTVVGFLTLTREASFGIKEVATRQGVMENPEFKALKDQFVRYLFGELQEYKASITGKITKTRVHHQEKANARLNLAIKDIQTLIPEAARRAKVEEVIKEVQHEIKESATERQQFEEDVVSEKEMYRALSSLGTSTLTFEHEIGPNYTIVNTLLKNILKQSGISDPVRTDIKNCIDILTEVQTWREYLDVFTSALGEMADVHKKKIKINPKQMIEDLLKKVTAVSPYVETNKEAEEKISYLVHTIGTNKTIYANKAILLAVFSNLILNSIKSLKFVGRKKPKIKVTINSNSKTKQLELLFEDNGNGIPDNNINKIWTAFKSFYPKHGKNREFRGMGLGLTLAKSIINESFNGDLELEKTISDTDDPGKGMARFKISIPLSELKE